MRRGARALLGAVLVLVTGTSAARAIVLKTIVVDGDMSDWAPVLADPSQHALDGPAGGLADRDAPVGTTGRDLTSFAWTWDSAYLYFYVSRVASDANRQRWWFYLDTNEDGLMSTGEYVVGVSWWGRNGTTTTELYRYTAVSPTGDPLGDPDGYADGWTMPGTVVSLGTVETGSGGAANGIEMEARISWANLGVAPGTPVEFHVSSSNSTNLPSSILDNMGGPGGLVGSTRIASVRLDPDRSGTASSPGTANFAHVATNLGSASDVLELSWTSSGTFAPSSVVFYRDANGNGVLDPGEPALADTDADGLPDTGPVAPGASVSILAAVAIPAGLADGAATTVVLTLASGADPSSTDPATDALSVATPAVTLVKSVDRATAAPGEALTYSLVYTGGGSVPAYAVTIEDAVPADTVYVAGSATGAGTTITFSHDGGATWDASETPPVTTIRWQRTSPLAPGSSGTTSFQAVVR